MSDRDGVQTSSLHPVPRSERPQPPQPWRQASHSWGALRACTTVCKMRPNVMYKYRRGILTAVPSVASPLGKMAAPMQFRGTPCRV